MQVLTVIARRASHASQRKPRWLRAAVAGAEHEAACTQHCDLEALHERAKAVVVLSSCKAYIRGSGKIRRVTNFLKICHPSAVEPNFASPIRGA